MPKSTERTVTDVFFFSFCCLTIIHSAFDIFIKNTHIQKFFILASIQHIFEDVLFICNAWIIMYPSSG